MYQLKPIKESNVLMPTLGSLLIILIVILELTIEPWNETLLEQSLEQISMEEFKEARIVAAGVKQRAAQKLESVLRSTYIDQMDLEVLVATYSKTAYPTELSVWRSSLPTNRLDWTYKSAYFKVAAHMFLNKLSTLECVTMECKMIGGVFVLPGAISVVILIGSAVSFYRLTLSYLVSPILNFQKCESILHSSYLRKLVLQEFFIFVVTLLIYFLSTISAGYFYGKEQQWSFSQSMEYIFHFASGTGNSPTLPAYLENTDMTSLWLCVCMFAMLLWTNIPTAALLCSFANMYLVAIALWNSKDIFDDVCRANGKDSKLRKNTARRPLYHS